MPLSVAVLLMQSAQGHERKQLQATFHANICLQAGMQQCHFHSAVRASRHSGGNWAATFGASARDRCSRMAPSVRAASRMGAAALAPLSAIACITSAVASSTLPAAQPFTCQCAQCVCQGRVKSAQ